MYNQAIHHAHVKEGVILMSDKEWPTGTKIWFWFVIIVNLGAAGYYLWQAYSLVKGVYIPNYTAEVLWGLTLMFVVAPGIHLVYAGLHVWLMRSMKKSALYTIIAWCLVFAAINLYLGEKNSLGGLLGALITYNASRKIVD